MSEAESTPEPTKTRTRIVTEVHLRDLQISTPSGAMSSIVPAHAKLKIKMVADLDARTIGIKVPGRGTTHVPFESCKYWKYGMGNPKLL